MEGYDFLYEYGAQDNATATGDGMIFTPAQPIDVYRFIIIADALIDVGAGMVVTLDHRPTAGSDTSRVTIATMTISADIAAGAGAYVTMDADEPFEVNPGEELVVEVTNAADTAGTFKPAVAYQRRAFVGTRIANLTDLTA